MTKKSNLLICLIFSIFSLTNVFAAQKEWVIGAQKFTFTRNQTDSVSEGIAVMLPARILEKMSTNLYREILTDEKVERELYTLKNDKNSLFLQLSSEVKKRDSLVLSNYSQSELNRKILDENKKIQEIKNKLDENIQRQKEIETLLEQNVNQVKNEHSFDERDSYSIFFKNFFSNAEVQESEKISLYKNDITALFTPSDAVKNAEISSALFEKEVMNAKISCLLTGTINSFDEYLSITVEAYVFPGCKKIATITEIGSIDDADYLTSNIARKLIPEITNSMPVTVKINFTNIEESAVLKSYVYIDDVLYQNTAEEFTIDSGVHLIQFTADGYKNAETNYYFTGNQKYSIDVTLTKKETDIIYIQPLKPVVGSFLANGVPASGLSDGKSKIVINGNAVLGEFITEDKKSAFIYIPENKLVSNALYTTNIKPIDRSDYIEKSRRRMYTSYSVLVTSLIPLLISDGISSDYQRTFTSTSNINDIKKVNTWIAVNNISVGVTVACGAWFIFELYRYFKAANSVLPSTAKYTLDYLPPEDELLDLTITENQAENEDINKENKEVN